MAGGRLVQAFYSASSGGYTESPAAWGDPSPPPWFPSKPDPYDAAGGRNPSHRWSVTFTAAQLSAHLAAVAAVGTVAALEVTAADASGRVTRMRVAGSRGTAGQHPPPPARPVVGPPRPHDLAAVDAENRRHLLHQRLLHRPGAQQRRRGERQPLGCAPHRDQPSPALLHHPGRRGHP